MMAQKTQSLFERIGGIPAVNMAVDIFYQKCLADPRISQFFSHIDLNRQGGKMKVFLACAFGAPIQYTGRSMREAHWYMHLNEGHFRAVSEHLSSTLSEMGVAPDLIREVMTIVLRTKGDIVHDGTVLPPVEGNNLRFEGWDDFTARQ